MATLSDGTATVSFSDALMWTDELQWSPVRQSVDRSITGALIVQAGAAVAGRPITLEAEDDMAGWVLRSVLEQMRVWAATPGQVLTLVYRGASRSVIWRVQDTAIEATPVVAYEDVQSGDFYRRVRLRFMEV